MEKTGIPQSEIQGTVDIVQDMLVDNAITPQQYAKVRDYLVNNNLPNAGYMDSNTNLGISEFQQASITKASFSDLAADSNVLKSIVQTSTLETIAENVGKASKVLGPLGIVAGVYFAGSEAKAQVVQGNYAGAVTTGVNFGASLAAGIAGAEIGAGIGAFAGPLGAIAGGLVGGIAGSLAADHIVEKVEAAGETIVDLLTGQ